MAAVGSAGNSATLPTFPEVRSTMKRVRKQQQPALPDTLADITLSESQKKLDGEDFVFWEPASQIMMLWSPAMKELIEGNSLFNVLFNSS